MATKPSPESPRRRFMLAAGALLAALAAGWWLFMPQEPSQLGADPDVFSTVDALYTAVRMQDSARLAQCQQRLHEFRKAGKLPVKPAEQLDSIVARARGGEWQSATETLYDFMLAQRRDGSAP